MGRPPAPATAVLLAAIGLAFLAETWAGGSTRPEVLLRLGANLPPLVLAGQWWRLLASVFLHIGLAHLLFNGWALYQLGGLLEAWVGAARMLGVFLAAGLAGSASSLLFTRGLSAGASGAIFGLLGALIGMLLRRRDRLQPAARRLLLQLGFWAAVNVVLGLSVPGIDNAAHLGGFAAGTGLGLALTTRWERRDPFGA